MPPSATLSDPLSRRPRRAVLTLTLNPALDRATSVPEILPDKKLRCAPETVEAGGGGLNVARAILQMGGQARAVAAFGGPQGSALRALLEAIGLDVVALPSPGETRLSFAVTETATGHQYRFTMPGPVWSRHDLDAALDALAEAAGPDAIVVLSGSMPPGADTGFATRAVARLAPADVVVDTSGAQLTALSHGQSPPPFVLRMDSHEAEALAGRPLTARHDSAEFAETLRQRGAGRHVIIARGADGSVLASPERRVHVTAAPVEVISMIGAGDSFVGGFCHALAAGADPPEALRLGAAAASAAVMTDGTELCHADDVRRLYPKCVLSAP